MKELLAVQFSRKVKGGDVCPCPLMTRFKCFLDLLISVNCATLHEEYFEGKQQSIHVKLQNKNNPQSSIWRAVDLQLHISGRATHTAKIYVPYNRRHLALRYHVCPPYITPVVQAGLYRQSVPKITIQDFYSVILQSTVAVSKGKFWLYSFKRANIYTRITEVNRPRNIIQRITMTYYISLPKRLRS